MELSINQIRTDGGTQARAGLDASTVAEYTAVFQSYPDTWPFPRLIVFYDGADYWLADGFHRLNAAAAAGRTAAAVDVQAGTRRDAVLYAAGANADHGLRRKRDDVQRAIHLLLNDPEWSQWSDRAIAQAVKCDHKTVGAARKAAPAPASGEIPQMRKFERNGQTHTMNTGNIGSNGSAQPDPGITAYEWLRDYIDSGGRTWQDLTENQTWHGSSPCWQAFTRDNPGVLKLHLQNARDRLVAERDNKPIPSPISRIYPDLAQSPQPDHVPGEAAHLPEKQPVTRAASQPVWALESDYRLYLKEGGQNDLDKFCTFLAETGIVYSRNSAKQAVNNVTDQLKRKTTDDRESIAELEQKIMVWYIGQRLNDIPAQLALMLEIKAQGEKHPQWNDMIDRLPHSWTAEHLNLAVSNLTAYLQDRTDELRATAVAPQPDPLPAEASPEPAIAGETAPAPLDSDEWYTPAWLIDMVKEVMTVIDLDPASCEAAQEIVQAGVWMGKNYGGAKGALGVNWILNSGPSWYPCRLWLNPPYSMPLILQFVTKLIHEIDAGHIEQAMLLTNNNTETTWWQMAAQAASVYLSFNTRIRFWNHDKESDSPRQGQTLFYFGQNVGRFADVFEDMGAISQCLTGEKAGIAVPA